ncbi:MAG: ribosomal-protein-serine acetyltransferase [Flavobacteriaceae bacterium]|nr:ribosomal-protein-serine acetyltransferase [Flavobacteriaceae bacterium]
MIDKEYKSLSKQKYIIEEFSISPIRDKDKYTILRWRNEQLYHLRQSKKISKKEQEEYFKHKIRPLFNKKFPEQILFSFFKDNLFKGYGGLVHIDWKNKNAEISFLINTNEEAIYFNTYWSKFLFMIEEVSFKVLGLSKIYIYSYNLRPKLYEVLFKNKFIEEARLVKHYNYKGKPIDILIHSKFL